MEAPLTEFELQREQIMARNRERLEELGLPELVSGLKALAPAATRNAKPRQAKASEPAQPTRHSGRLRGEAAEPAEPEPEPEPVSPKKGKKKGGAKKKGGGKKGAAAKKKDLAPEEVEAERLAELELGGLVEFTPRKQPGEELQPAAKRQRGEGEDEDGEPAAAAGDADEQAAQEEEEEPSPAKGKKTAAGKKRKAAKGKKGAAAAAADDPDGPCALFVVVGSKNNHYKVKLMDGARKCECMDHRIRKHDCKHIRLILEQLGVASTPTQWEQALERQVQELAPADPEDVERILGQEARAKERRAKAAAAEPAGAPEDDEEEMEAEAAEC